MTAEAPLRIVLFGDSVFAGYGLPQERQPATLLQERLRADAIVAEVTSAGVPDETAEEGLARVSSISGDLVLVEFGLNDAIRGVAQENTARALEAIVKDLQSRSSRIVLVEARVPASSTWPALTAHARLIARTAQRCGVGFCPDILAQLAAEPGMLQDDGLHPNAVGADVLVERLIRAIRKA